MRDARQGFGKGSWGLGTQLLTVVTSLYPLQLDSAPPAPPARKADQTTSEPKAPETGTTDERVKGLEAEKAVLLKRIESLIEEVSFQALTFMRVG